MAYGYFCTTQNQNTKILLLKKKSLNPQTSTSMQWRWSFEYAINVLSRGAVNTMSTGAQQHTGFRVVSREQRCLANYQFTPVSLNPQCINLLFFRNSLQVSFNPVSQRKLQSSLPSFYHRVWVTAHNLRSKITHIQKQKKREKQNVSTTDGGKDYMMPQNSPNISSLCFLVRTRPDTDWSLTPYMKFCFYLLGLQFGKMIRKHEHEH